VKVRIWGARGSVPAPGGTTYLYGGNTSCVAVEVVPGALTILDAGTGIRALGASLTPDIRRLDLLLTHLHMDHILGLGFFAGFFTPGLDVHVWGPSSATQGLHERLTRYLSPPLFPVRMRDLPCELTLHNVPDDTFDVPGLDVRADRVCHPGYTLAYRLDDGRGTLAYMPDHEPALGVYKFPLRPEWTSGYGIAEGVDVLIHDAQFSDEEYDTHVGWGHSSINHTLAFAKLAEVGHLVAFHHDPNHDDLLLNQLYHHALDRELPFGVTVAREGTTFEVTRRRVVAEEPDPPADPAAPHEHAEEQRMSDRLSPLDATFLHLEDAVTHMHIASVLEIEGPPPTTEEMLAMIAGKLALLPRYRQVVKFVPLQLGRPVWVDDQHFNLEYHVRHTALPAPGGRDELRRLVGRIMSQQLDRTKPLWEIWAVDGLENGRWALISKVHHCMVDGVSGTEMLTVTLDLSPEPSPPVPDRWRPRPAPSSVDLAREAILSLLRSPYEQARAVRAATRAPRLALGQLREVGGGVAAMSGLVRPTPLSSLNGPIGPHRRYAWASVSVDDVKRVRKGVGGTFNDVILAVITAGFRALIESRDESTDRVVRTLVPVSVRARDESGRAVGDGTFENKVSAMFAELPVGIADPLDRLRAVSAQLDGLKKSNQAVAGEALTSLSGFAPPALLALGTRIATKAGQRNINTVTTNVPGPQLPLYVLGRRVRKAFPYVPLGGQMRVGVAIFSYDGQVNFGVTGDYDSAPDIHVLARGIERGMSELRRAAT
jgi:diacylglycerol O-acyltransferase